MAIPDDFKRELSERSDLGEIASRYITLKRSGRMLQGLCPFHSEKTPSFYIYTDSNSYYCFGCQKGGDVISFIEQVENLDFMEAVKFLADKAGMTVPEEGMDTGRINIRRRVFEQNRAAALFFYEQLYTPGGREALRYLHDRGLTDESIKRFGVGYAPDSWDALSKHLMSKGYRGEEIITAKLAFQNRYGKPCDFFRDRIMFPVIDLQKNVIAFGGRVYKPGATGGKYVNTAESPVYTKGENLYGMNIAKNSKGDEIILCEGFMDAIAMHQAGITNAVASQGTAVTRKQAKLIAKYAKRVIIAQDGDEAGQNSIKRSIPEMQAEGLEIRVVVIKGAKDPDEYIKKYGAEKFRKLIEGSASGTEYLIDSIRAKHDMGTDSGRVNFLREVSKLLSTLDTIERDIYASRIATELGVDKSAIISTVKKETRKKTENESREEFRRLSAQATGRADEVNTERRNNVRAAKIEEEIIACLFKNPDYYPLIKDRLTKEKFVTSFNRTLYSAIVQQIESGFQPAFASMTEHLTDTEMSSLVRIVNTTQRERMTKEEFSQLGDELIRESEKMTPEKASSASAQELKDYIESLRKQKTGKK